MTDSVSSGNKLRVWEIPAITPLTIQMTQTGIMPGMENPGNMAPLGNDLVPQPTPTPTPLPTPSS